jgi:4-amino-4-deoxy-L-arabinose transferase-like glycosyltransferase
MSAPRTPRLERLDDLSRSAIDWLSQRPRMAAAALLALSLLAYLPGLVGLPPVDRTEVVYAQMSRTMLQSGDALDAHYQEERFPFRPIGITWLQAATGKALGKSTWGWIGTYRLPSLIAAVLAVLALWKLSAPLVGPRASLIAAAFFAVTPVVALQSQLAIPEGPLLLAIVVAQLALLRLYCATGDGLDAKRLALGFWAAQGGGILLNALALPILSLSTLIALFFFDRDLAWLKRLRPLVGIPLMLVIAAPWVLVRAHADGGMPFATLDWHEFLRALGGAQDMKWKAAPLTFTLGLVLGFLPGALLLVPALKGLWNGRAEPLQRFLLSWIVGYLLYLELISSKPALYTVQAMFPAAALAAALVMQRQGRLVLPDYMLRLPAWLVAPGMAALFAAVFYLGGAIGVALAIGALIVTAIFTLAAAAARQKFAAAWLLTSVVGFALFLGFTFGLLLPSFEQGWPAKRIAAAIAPLERCVVGPVGVLGFREPSATFVLGPDADANAGTIASRMAGGDEGIAVIEDRWHPDLLQALQERRADLPKRVGCVSAFNVMRGCRLDFSIYLSGRPQIDANCQVRPEFTCSKPVRASAGPGASRCR